MNWRREYDSAARVLEENAMKYAVSPTSAILLVPMLALFFLGCTSAPQEPQSHSVADDGVSAASTPAGASSAESAEDRDRNLDSMIEALANRANKAPYITGPSPGQGAIFSEPYDKAEQDRSREAVRELNQHSGN